MKTLITLLFLVSATTHAATTHNFYPQETLNQIKQSHSVKEALFALLSTSHTRRSGKRDILGCNPKQGMCYSQKSLGYKGARKVLFGNIHLEKDSKGYYIKDVYCNKTIRSQQAKVGPGKIPNHSIINCEHTWPQSKFTSRFPRDMQKSDLHHLYPTDSHANSVRGNYRFDEVNGTYVDNSDCTASRTEGHGGNFEPPTEHKGNVARALFYFSVRYQMELPHGYESLLRKWHEIDPVDSEERERNNIIYSVQNNRNPFVDMPHLVDRISNF